MAATASSSSTPRRSALRSRPDEARDLAELGMRIVAAANAQLGFVHPENAGWDHISFCQFAGPLHQEDGALTRRQRGGDPPRQDRPLADRHRLLRPHGDAARQGADEGRRPLSRALDHRLGPSTAGSTPRRALGGRPAIVPVISGQAWITGTHQHMLDPTDPCPRGYRLSDTWPTSETGARAQDAGSLGISSVRSARPL